MFFYYCTNSLVKLPIYMIKYNPSMKYNTSLKNLLFRSHTMKTHYTISLMGLTVTIYYFPLFLMETS